MHLSLGDWQRGDELCLLFPFGESQGCLSFAFPLPSISDHTVGAFGFKAPERERADGLQPHLFPFCLLQAILLLEKLFPPVSCFSGAS